MNLRLLNTQRFPMGPGLFETFLVENSSPIFFKDHWERLGHSCKRLGLSFPFSFQKIEERIAAIAKKKNQKYKVRLIYKNEQKGPLLALQFLPLKEIPKKITLAPMVMKPHPLAGFKTTNRNTYEMLHKQATVQGAWDALFISASKEVLETSRANLFLAIHGRVYTPPADGQLLPGITRKQTIEILKELKIPCFEKKVEVNELLAADEIFVTNSIIGVRPVCQIFKLRKEIREGKLIKRLQNEFSLRCKS